MRLRRVVPGVNLQSTDFELFGLAQQFALDRAALDLRWKALQREVHPDRFAAAGEAAQRVALQWSVRINEAYQRLKDPIARASYLCQLGGVAVDAHSNTAMPHDFLLQQMQWREEMDDCTGADELERLGERVALVREALMEQCAQSLDAKPDLGLAAQRVRALMFVDKFARDLSARLEGLET